MSEVDVFKIVLKRPEALYKPGETVRGVVYLELNKEKQCKGLTFEAKGLSSVQWKEYNRLNICGVKSTYIKKMHAEKCHMDEMSTMLVSGEGESKISALPRGIHRHKFAVKIPPEAPGTLEEKGKTGYIRYELTAELSKPHSWDTEYRATKSLNVTPLLDLKHTPQLSKPLSMMLVEKLGWSCRKSGVASALFTVERTGYAPGERVVVYVTVDKLTYGSMTVKARLLKGIKYHAGGKTMGDYTVVAKPQYSVQLSQGDKWNGAMLQVPDLYPTMDGIIEIAYVLKLKVKFSFGGSKSLKIPITIGTESCAGDEKPPSSRTKIGTKLTNVTQPNSKSTCPDL